MYGRPIKDPDLVLVLDEHMMCRPCGVYFGDAYERDMHMDSEYHATISEEF